jgi:hypothetical protein
MTTATINVAYVNQPKPGKKQGNVKTDTGEYYGVALGMLGMFSPGGRYEVSYSSREFNSKTYHTIETVNKVGEAPRASGGGGAKHGPVDDATAERIFVQGILQAFIRAGKIETTTPNVVAAVKSLRSAWSQTFGTPAVPAPASSKNEDMNDEIPF